MRQREHIRSVVNGLFIYCTKMSFWKYTAPGNQAKSPAFGNLEAAWFVTAGQSTSGILGTGRLSLYAD